MALFVHCQKWEKPRCLQLRHLYNDELLLSNKKEQTTDKCSSMNTFHDIIHNEIQDLGTSEPQYWTAEDSQCAFLFHVFSGLNYVCVAALVLMFSLKHFLKCQTASTWSLEIVWVSIIALLTAVILNIILWPKFMDWLSRWVAIALAQVCGLHLAGCWIPEWGAKQVSLVLSGLSPKWLLVL